MTAEAAVERLTEMLSQQMETAARDRMEAREREERLTERLLSLATSTQAALQDRQHLPGLRTAWPPGGGLQNQRFITRPPDERAAGAQPEPISGISGHCRGAARPLETALWKREQWTC
ncbi:uncharacterized protein LOC122391560 isoform X2 [Amphibalanus amphitrite]|uniref:uncharacterized protein LOC122391560 isoform X2 n=1 Tax=Amphibalanus amphitrite TaxID=1232801 RepID=UPI001C8FBA3C|nr:uncharacterized protein LOC122391560 isoform X2 [Amphibalanus amphitrite]